MRKSIITKPMNKFIVIFFIIIYNGSMIDTHSHINFEEYKTNFDEFLENLRNNDIEKVIIPGVEPSTFEEIVDICQKYNMLYGAIGVHPSECLKYNEAVEQQIYKYSKNPKIVAIGEIGLDYYWTVETKQQQQNILRKQLTIAEDMQLPVIIHDRNAHEDTFNILNEFNNLKDVIFHCFSADPKFAKRCIDKGYYIAIGGVVTFKNANDLKETAKIVPADRLLLETDAPYLTPVPYRGKLNSPEYLKYIAKEIATLRNTNTEEIKEQTTINAKRIFNFQ